jgi:hypothetical protein
LRLLSEPADCAGAGVGELGFGLEVPPNNFFKKLIFPFVLFYGLM